MICRRRMWGTLTECWCRTFGDAASCRLSTSCRHHMWETLIEGWILPFNCAATVGRPQLAGTICGKHLLNVGAILSVMLQEVGCPQVAGTICRKHLLKVGFSLSVVVPQLIVHDTQAPYVGNTLFGSVSRQRSVRRLCRLPK